MIILDGRQTANNIHQELQEKISLRAENQQKIPHLAAILVGDNPASRAYINTKIKACSKVGMKSSLITFDTSVTQDELLAKVYDLNSDSDIDGFIVQLPLPTHIDEDAITLAIDSTKDVDGFHPINLGRMMLGLPGILPATPMGILELVRRYEIDMTGKNCLVLGRSHIVGTPISILLSRKSSYGNATVTLAHSRTKNIQYLALQADVIIAAIGIPEYLTGDMVKDDVVVIDVGISRVDDETRSRGYRLVGDVDFDSVSRKASYITPVPGGVGPMTVASLLLNTLKAVELRETP